MNSDIVYADFHQFCKEHCHNSFFSGWNDKNIGLNFINTFNVVPNPAFWYYRHLVQYPAKFEIFKWCMECGSSTRFEDDKSYMWNSGAIVLGAIETALFRGDFRFFDYFMTMTDLPISEHYNALLSETVSLLILYGNESRIINDRLCEVINKYTTHSMFNSDGIDIILEDFYGGESTSYEENQVRIALAPYVDTFNVLLKYVVI